MEGRRDGLGSGEGEECGGGDNDLCEVAPTSMVRLDLKSMISVFIMAARCLLSSSSSSKRDESASEAQARTRFDNRQKCPTRRAAQVQRVSYVCYDNSSTTLCA